MPERDRPDLAAMVTRLRRDLIAAELPVLQKHAVSMWGYSVLTALATRPVRTQAALAEAIHADKTRIIPVLDELQRRGLIRRHPDPADRRVRLLEMTEEGSAVFAAVRAEIRVAERRLLAALPADVRENFVRGLRALTGHAED